MAGSYNHCVNDDGTLLRGKAFLNQIENLGDANEAIEEMYGMIWWLAGHLAVALGAQRVELEARSAAAVEDARQHYKMGIEAWAPGGQKAQW